ncbi:MAG: HAD family hydrolase [archaeon]|nr:HAD family hydrolase [archaeon]
MVIWDLDGTITDSRQCIISSYRYAARMCGLPEPSEELLSTMMCGGLQEHMRMIFGKVGEEADILSGHFSRYYAEHYLQEARMFPLFPEVFDILEKRGVVQAVATMNREEVAVGVLSEMGIADRFVHIAGADEKGEITKTQMIRDCVSGGDFSRILMVGDCPSDRRAAENAGVEFVAAAYGYGYSREECGRDSIMCMVTTDDLLGILEADP